MDVKELGSRRMDPDVDPFERGAARQPDHPTAKGSAIIGMNNTLDRRQTREKLFGIDAKNTIHLARADQVIGSAFPFPASNTRDALGPGELIRQAASAPTFAFCDVAR